MSRTYTSNIRGIEFHIIFYSSTYVLFVSFLFNLAFVLYFWFALEFFSSFFFLRNTGKSCLKVDLNLIEFFCSMLKNLSSDGKNCSV